MAKKKSDEQEAEASEQRRCFVITPIGDPGTPTRRLADGVFDAVVEPVLRELGFAIVTVAHRIDDPGSINAQVIRRLDEYELVVADLTETNPNVMYELAIRHCVGKPVVIIAKRGQRLPFDVQHERMIPYDDDLQGGIDLRKELASKVKNALEAAELDNPVVAALNRRDIIKRAEASGQTVAVADVMREFERMLAAQRDANTQHEDALANPLYDERFAQLEVHVQGLREGELHTLAKRVSEINADFKVTIGENSITVTSARRRIRDHHRTPIADIATSLGGQVVMMGWRPS